MTHPPPVTPIEHNVIRALVRTIEEWYVQDQGDVIGEQQAIAAAHREVAAVRSADELLRPR